MMRNLFRPMVVSIALAGLALLAMPAQARDIRLCTLNWAPYYAEDLPRDGFFTALVKRAFERGGHEATIDFMPWARALLEVKQGDCDVAHGAYYSAERAKTYLISEPIYSDLVGIIARPELGITSFDSLHDLEGHSIGYGRGYTVSEGFDSAEYLNKVVEENHVLNLRKLAAGRVDMIAGSFANLRYIAKEEGIDLSKMVFLEPPLDAKTLHIMVSLAIPDSKELLADFHRGLAAIRADGTYDRILRQMGFQ